jgi:hypothetical protein
MLITWANSNAYAQIEQNFGLSVKYDYVPYKGFSDPRKGTFEEDLELQENKFSVQMSFPIEFSDGKTSLKNHINYHKINFNFRNWDEVQGGNQINQVQSISYTFFLTQKLSEKWQLVAVTTPGIASDFERDISRDDITFQGVLGFIRQFNKDLAIGTGVAYIRDFGDPEFLPFLYLQWNIRRNLIVQGLIPTNMSLLYRLNPKVDLGLLLQVEGNRYHGDPDKFNVDNPQLEYTIGTIGPAAQIHISKWVHLFIEGGYTFMRNFEFRDGDNKVRSLDTEKTVYLRSGILLGM